MPLKLADSVVLSVEFPLYPEAVVHLPEVPGATGQDNALFCGN